MIGEIILHYKIFEKLGEGGMGVVYLAEDTRLKRQVAIKFLPSHIAQNSDERKRFEIEAQAAAALNHNNIAHIYAIEETDNEMFIVMELIDGIELKDKIKSGPINIEYATNVAIQIVEGLQTAHKKDIVHRDIKSSNIMITEDGKVKIMDFGLAKFVNRTMLTQQGTTLGTIDYMSPEQARGETVSNSFDIWSLGVVLYEMVSGQLPFKGDYEQAVVYSIMNEDPEPITGLRTGVPIELERIINKAMAKSPDERYQNIDEMLVDLRILKKTLAILVKKASTGSKTFNIQKKTKRQFIIPWSITVLTVVVAIVVWILYLTTPQPEQMLMRFVHSLPPGQMIEDVEFYGSAVTLSPDGSQLVYTATDSGGSTQLYRRFIDQFEATQINGTKGAGNPFFSFDGQWVGFFASGKLQKISLAGGVPITICEAQTGYGASWGPDNTIIFSPTFTSGLLRISAAGGTPQIVTKLKSAEGELSHRWPEILPDGKSVLFTINTGMDADAKHVAALSLTSGKRSIVVRDATDARYTSAGYLIYVRAGLLMAVPFDVEKLEVTGPAVKVLDGVKYSGEGSGQYSFSRNGILVWIPAPGIVPFISEDSSPVSFRKVAESSLVWIDRQGVSQRLPLPLDGYWAPSISPDGRRLALTIELDIFILDLDRSALTRFTFEGNNHLPVWSPDGQRLTFSSARNGHPNLFWKMTDGSGVAEQLLTSKQHQDPGSWSPDGKILAFAELHSETNWDIWLLRLENDPGPEPFLQTRFNEYHPMISPDGRWLAYTSNESGRQEIYVRPFPGGRGKWLISTEGGREPLWSRDGSELFYRTGGKLMAVTINTESSFVAGRPRLLFEGEYDGKEMQPFGSPNYDVSLDGRFLMIKPDPSPPSTQINFVLNWLEELKQSIPEGN